MEFEGMDIDGWMENGYMMGDGWVMDGCCINDGWTGLNIGYIHRSKEAQFATLMPT